LPVFEAKKKRMEEQNYQSIGFNANTVQQGEQFYSTGGSTSNDRGTSTPFGRLGRNNEYVSMEEEFIPQQTVHWVEACSPIMKRYAGVGIANMFFSVAYVLIVLSVIMSGLRTIVAGFQEFHWALGILFMIITVLMSFAIFFFSVTFLRLAVELIISVFQIREKINKMQGSSIA
jgi:hypothetical protein